MNTLAHILLFLFSSAVIWFFAGMLIESVDRVAKHFHKSGFAIAFFILGFLTSISEISVATNSWIEGVPQVSVGNLIGASFVILLFIIPFLAVTGKGVQLRHTLSHRNLQLSLLAILLPALFVIDGRVTRLEGLSSILAFAVLLFLIENQKDSVRADVQIIEKDLLGNNIGWRDGAKILLGGIFIFIAGHFLVEQAVYFANALHVPNSIIGLILLSIGTNVPELVVAAQSILKKRKDIAFGDYIGSAATNTLIFGVLVLVNGSFVVEASEFILTVILTMAGLICFYFFASSKWVVTRKEGLILLSFYAAFLVIQLMNMVRLYSG